MNVKHLTFEQLEQAHNEHSIPSEQLMHAAYLSGTDNKFVVMTYDEVAAEADAGFPPYCVRTISVDGLAGGVQLTYQADGLYYYSHYGALDDFMSVTS